MSAQRDWATMAMLIAILIVLALLFSALAEGQDARPRTREERALISLVARVSFNEALDSYEDLALIWQVTESHGSTHRQRRAWLERHSSCVSGRLSREVAEARPGNCRWTRNLTPDGAQPEGWDRALHGRWDWIRDRWLAHIPRVRAFVLGSDGYRPCEAAPQSWDGARWEAQILARGHRIANCGRQNVGVYWFN